MMWGGVTAVARTAARETAEAGGAIVVTSSSIGAVGCGASAQKQTGIISVTGPGSEI